MVSNRGPSTPDLAALGAEGMGTFIYGADRPSLLRVAFALARHLDPHPYWVDIREPSSTGTAEVPGLGRIAGDHLFIVSSPDARPQDAEANMALWTVVRSDEPASVVSGFVDFLRLPPAIQEAVSRSRSPEGRPVFVVANTDRVRPYYPTQAAEVRPIVNAFVRAGVVPIFASLGPPGAGRWAFDFVFEVRPGASGNPEAGVLACERAPPTSPVASGVQIPFPHVPGLLTEPGPGEGRSASAGAAGG